jgi:hypothetical protein
MPTDCDDKDDEDNQDINKVGVQAAIEQSH